MARTRLLKPDFFRDEDVATMEPMARLLFAGLWTIADRRGRIKDRPKRIRADVLPYDMAAPIDYLLGSLLERGLIRRPGDGFIWIVDVDRWSPEQDEYGPSWPLARSAARKRDGNRCAECGSTAEELHVHHIVTLQSFCGDTESANQLDNLITLCGPCHRSKHRLMKTGAT